MKLANSTNTKTVRPRSPGSATTKEEESHRRKPASEETKEAFAVECKPHS